MGAKAPAGFFVGRLQPAGEESFPDLSNKPPHLPSKTASRDFKPTIKMKTIIAAIAISAFTFIGSSVADARPHRHSSHVYISSYKSCGSPVYKERYFVGYDRWGNEIWKTRLVRQSYRPVVRPRYVAPCPPPRHVHRDYGRGYGRGVTIHAHFGR
jgi:hypothetical protein